MTHVGVPAQRVRQHFPQCATCCVFIVLVVSTACFPVTILRGEAAERQRAEDRRLVRRQNGVDTSVQAPAERTSRGQVVLKLTTSTTTTTTRRHTDTASRCLGGRGGRRAEEPGLRVVRPARAARHVELARARYLLHAHVDDPLHLVHVLLLVLLAVRRLRSVRLRHGRATTTELLLLLWGLFGAWIRRA